MEKVNYDLMHVETCLCVWEYLAELRLVDTRAEEELGVKTLTCHLEKHIEKHGTASTRIELIGSSLILEIEKQWKQQTENEPFELFGCFDFEYVPAFVGHFIELTQLDFGFICNEKCSDLIIKHLIKTHKG